MALNPLTASSDRQSAGWDLKNAVRNYSTLVAAQVAVAAFSFASVWLLTQYIGADGYGSVVAVIAASQVAQIFVNWTGVGLARHGVEEFVASGRITESFWARTAIFLPNTIIFLLFGFLWLPLLSSLLKLPPGAMGLVAAHFAASAAWLHVQYALQAAKMLRLQGVMLAAERILIFAALGVMLAGDRLDLNSAILAYAAAPVIVMIVSLIAVRDYYSWHIKLSQSAIKKILVFSLPLLPFSLIGYFSTNYLDAIFISQYLSKADLAVYSIAYQINGILIQFSVVAGTLLLPLFVTLSSHGKRDRVVRYMESLLPLLTLAGSLGAAVTAGVVTLVLPSVFGPASEQIAILLWVLVSAAAIAVPNMVGYAPYMNSISATYIATIMAAAAAAVNLTANYFLIPRYGLKGAAWATVLSYGASVITAVVILHVRHGVRHRWILPALAPALAASAYASLTGGTLVAFVIGFAAATVVALVWLRGVRDGLRIVKEFRAFAAD